LLQCVTFSSISDGFFVVVESELAVVAVIRVGVMQRVRAIGMGRESLGVLLEREALLNGFPVLPSVWVFATSQPGIPTDGIQFFPSESTEPALSLAKISVPKNR
jgi:hypothetical protein